MHCMQVKSLVNVYTAYCHNSPIFHSCSKNSSYWTENATAALKIGEKDSKGFYNIWNDSFCLNFRNEIDTDKYNVKK